MPGRQVKNWKLYHHFRRQGLGKSLAARRTNWVVKRRRLKRARRKRRK